MNLRQTGPGKRLGLAAWRQLGSVWSAGVMKPISMHITVAALVMGPIVSLHMSEVCLW